MKFFLLFLAIGATTAMQSACADSGSTESGSYSNANGTRAYELFIPSGAPANRPLFVVLHGCFMTAAQMAEGTNFNSQARKNDFYVLYPEQGYLDNAWKCWNWFRPENLERDQGEASIVAGMTRQVLQDYSLDERQVFIVGISAGGAYASDLMGCYSDLYHGVAVHSGMEYGAARTEDEAHEVARTGSTRDLDESAQTAVQCSPVRSTLIPTIVIHGTADPHVNPINSERVGNQFFKINQLISPTKNVSQEKSRIRRNGPNFSANVTDVFFNGSLTMRYLQVEGMGHGWSGGRPSAPYMEPRGIDATSIIVDFFLNKSLK